MHPLLKFLHLASVVVWVGGMFFAYVCLRPVAAAQLDPPARLSLWAAVFARFFPWVWLALALILGSGLQALLAIGFAVAPPYWHLMFALGLVMGAIFLYVFFVPYPALRSAVAAQQWPAGGAALGSIRRWVGINLSLGVLTILAATAGRLL
jgi:uncharacterized membrane protein